MVITRRPSGAAVNYRFCSRRANDSTNAAYYYQASSLHSTHTMRTNNRSITQILTPRQLILAPRTGLSRLPVRNFFNFATLLTGALTPNAITVPIYNSFQLFATNHQERVLWNVLHFLVVLHHKPKKHKLKNHTSCNFLKVTLSWICSHRI